METKPRILYLQKILLERTDEENPLSTTQLINILNDEYGISAHRTTVTKDIAALQEFGMDIVTIHSTQSKYFVASRKFELPELKLLIDAVESSKFITKKKSETLIEKIHTMTSPGQVAKLKRNNYVVNRIKPDNEQMYDELKRSEGDNPTIGIVLCSDTDDDIARYSVMHDNEQLFASKYKLYLPTKEELKAEIETQKAMFYLQQQDNEDRNKNYTFNIE